MVAGDRHRDHHLGQVVTVVLGLAEPALPSLDRHAETVVGVRFGLQVGQLVGAVDLPVGGGGVDEDDVDVQVQQVRDRVEDPRRDIAQRVEQEIHCRIGGIVGEPDAVGDRGPLGDPPGGGQLAARFQARWPPARTTPARPRRRRSAARQPPAAAPPRCRSAPQLVQYPSSAEAARVEHLDLAGVRGGDRLVRVEEPRDRGHQPGQRLAIDGVGAAEAVDHLRRRDAGDRVALAVRQLQITDHAAVAVAPLRLSEVHTYSVSTYPLFKSSDTPQLVCLHLSGVQPHRNPSTSTNARRNRRIHLQTPEVRVSRC